MSRRTASRPRRSPRPGALLLPEIARAVIPPRYVVSKRKPNPAKKARRKAQRRARRIQRLAHS